MEEVLLVKQISMVVTIPLILPGLHLLVDGQVFSCTGIHGRLLMSSVMVS